MPSGPAWADRDNHISCNLRGSRISWNKPKPFQALCEIKDLALKSDWGGGRRGFVFVLARGDQIRLGPKNAFLLKTRLKLKGLGKTPWLQRKDICHFGECSRQLCYTAFLTFAISLGNNITGAFFMQSFIKRNRFNGSAVTPRKINITLFRVFYAVSANLSE